MTAKNAIAIIQHSYSLDLEEPGSLSDMRFEWSIRLCVSAVATSVALGEALGEGAMRGSGRPRESVTTLAAGGYRPREAGPNSGTEHVTTLGFISKAAKDIGKKRGKEIPELLPLVEQIESDVKFLREEWSKWAGKYGRSAPAVPVNLDPYYRSLVGNATILKEVQNRPETELLEATRNVARDIHNKALNCRNSADGLGKQVVVHVKTVQDKAELAGFEVFYVPMALLSEKVEHKRFPTLSSPATHNNIPPGFYALWLKRDNKTNVHTCLDIVSDRSAVCNLEIAVANEFLTPPEGGHAK